MHYKSSRVINKKSAFAFVLIKCLLLSLSELFPIALKQNPYRHLFEEFLIDSTRYTRSQVQTRQMPSAFREHRPETND